ncbi:MAG: hypothetical protein HOP96_08250 [Sphingomonas sp.]|nr:hypothetical protein [Sphingomonas sp.]
MKQGFAGKSAGSKASVRLDRALAARTVLIAVLLLWPLVLFGRPAYIADSAAYVKGGQAAVEFVRAKVAPPMAATNPATAGAPASEAAGVKGVRSIAYSVVAYAFRAPGNTMIALAILQTLVAAFICAVVLASAGVRSVRTHAGIGLALAGASSLPTFTSFALPDVFAGILAASLITLFASLERLTLGVRLALVLIASFAVAAHASIVPLAVWLCFAGAMFAWWFRSRLQQAAARVAWLFAPLMIGALVTAAAGFIAFGETSVAAKHYPHALARSVSDGPARWYLERECRTPSYEVCEVFGTHLPTTVSGFLFGDNGLDGRATPEQMDRIRAEEGEIVWRAAMAYPAFEFGNLARHVVRQAFYFGVRPTRFGDLVTTGSAGEAVFVEMPDRPSPAISVLDLATYVLLALCALWVVLNIRRLSDEQRLVVGLIVSVLAVNAAFCVLASGLTDRYQARLAWIAPLFVLSFVISSAGGLAGRFRTPRRED